MSLHSDFQSFKLAFVITHKKKSTKFSIPRMISYSELMRVSLWKIYNKMFSRNQENDKFRKILLSIYLEKFAHSFQSFTKCFSYLVV